MKLLTHKLYLYDNGFCWKWVKKGDDDKGYTLDGRDIIIWCLILWIIVQ